MQIFSNFWDLKIKILYSTNSLFMSMNLMTEISIKVAPHFKFEAISLIRSDFWNYLPTVEINILSRNAAIVTTTSINRLDDRHPWDRPATGSSGPSIIKFIHWVLWPQFLRSVKENKVSSKFCINTKIWFYIYSKENNMVDRLLKYHLMRWIFQLHFTAILRAVNEFW